MTIDILKVEAEKLSKLEKLEFLQFLAQLLSEEERAAALTREQEQLLFRRREDVKAGRVQTVPATQVKANLADKHGLRG